MTAGRERPDAAMPLVRALLADAAAAGCAARLVSADACDWASATFVGAQHRVVLAVAGTEVEEWLAALTEADLPLWRHIVADLTIDAVEIGMGGERHVTLSVLTLIAA